MKLLIINKGRDLSVVRGDELFALDRTGIDKDELLWALEEYNRCDIGEWTIIKEDYEGDE